MDLSSDNNVSSNIISNLTGGVGALGGYSNGTDGIAAGLYGKDSENNTITNCFFMKSEYGLLLISSSHNLCYHNNIINNTQNANDTGTNTWYNAALREGNYWSDYTGEDNNHDGIGDTPYTIPGNDGNQDCYPFMKISGWEKPIQPPSTPPATPSQNNKPTANAGGPYKGFLGEEIQFNGPKSSDSDGKIISYEWNYGDGTNGAGNITTHSYSRKGTYTIILTVTDDDGAKDTDETSAVILQANNPPTHPTISGPTKGHTGTIYTFTAVSNDADNDSIQYIVDWGDSTTNTSEFLPNGTICIMNHSWMGAGIYLISMKAYDNYTESGLAYFIGLIDIQYCGDIGYLIDNHSGGTYDLFYCNESGNKISVGQKDGKYLIDTNGDGNWEYTFNLTEGLAAIRIAETKGAPGFELIFVICAIVVSILLWKKKRII